MLNSSTYFKSVPIDCLERGQYQPRTYFDENHLEELAQSIRSQGIIEPIIVRQSNNNCYEIIAGERRWRAAILAGLTEVPCLVKVLNDQEAAAATLIENIQREDLSLLEEANGCQRLYHEFHFNQEEIATLLGKSRSYITNLLRLLTLCPSVKDLIHSGQLSLGHARMLVGLEECVQVSLSSQVIHHQWSVRKLEDEVRATKMPVKALQVNRDIARLETQLAEQIGAPVQLLPDSHQGGWLKIKYYDNDTLDGLLERMGLRYD
jgi:ParB family chromosome partitioning protein